MDVVQLSPAEVLPWLVRDGSGRAVSPSYETREDAEHAAGKVSGGSVWRDCFSAANTDALERFVEPVPVVLAPMRRFGAWGDDG